MNSIVSRLFGTKAANNDPRQIRRISFRQVAKIDDLFEKQEIAAYCRITAANDTGLPPIPDLLLPAPEQIANEHRMSAQTSDVVLGTLANVTVSGRSILGSGRELFSFGSPLMPDYVATYLENGWMDGHPHSLAGLSRREIPGICVMLTHFNIGVYGHWLLEGLPRLLLLKRLRRELPELSILLPGRVSPPFIRDWCKLVAPEIPLLEYDGHREFVQCERLLLPGLLTSPYYFLHPLTNDLIEDVRSLAAPPPSTSHTAIYLTRKEQSFFRHMTNRDEIQSVAEQRGLSAISPETLSIPEQIRLFADAKLIVGEFGSALHNSLFSADIDLLSLNWINAIQSRIAQLRAQRVGYVLPDAGPLIFVRELDNVQRGYTINPGKFSEALASLTERSLF